MESPLLSWSTDGRPHSKRFDEAYFTSDKDLQKSQAVFIEPNHLAERFRQLKDGALFTLAETGFGAGLNCLNTLRLFRQQAPSQARLCYISTEQFPLTPAEITTSLKPWPSLQTELTELLAKYPHPIPGFHSIELDERIELLLLWGDANHTLIELNAQVDAWFLDGFTPAKNPELWQPNLYVQMHRLSSAKATVATGTSTQPVRDGLTGAGFKLTSHDGHNGLRGYFIGQQGPLLLHAKSIQPLCEWSWPTQDSSTQTAIIIGAGLAGAHTAWELAKRGWSVTVLDQADVAAGASGNHQGALYAKLSHQDSISNRFYTQALCFAQQRLAALPPEVAHQQCGLIQLPQNNPRDAKRFQQFFKQNPLADSLVTHLNAEQTNHHTGLALNSEALYFPEGGWISPIQLTRYRLEHPNIRVLTHHQVTNLTGSPFKWQVQGTNQQGHWELDSPQVILTAAWQSQLFAQSQYLPLQGIAGQITQIAGNSILKPLNKVLCWDHYLLPAYQNQHSLGATFRLKQTDATILAADDAENLAAMKQLLPHCEPLSTHTSRASVRCASPDYLPLLGPLIDAPAFTTRYRHELKKHRNHRYSAPPWHRGLWVNTAHGSKGLCSIPLAAKTLAAWLNQEPLPLPNNVLNHLNPNRFLIRRIKKE